jgi:hypothetical protein
MTAARPRVSARRRCFDCGAVDGEASFPGARKPSKRRDQCTECATFPLEVFEARVAARRAEIAALRAAGSYRAQKPITSTPLFAALRSS